MNPHTNQAREAAEMAHQTTNFAYHTGSNPKAALLHLADAVDHLANAIDNISTEHPERYQDKHGDVWERRTSRWYMLDTNNNPASAGFDTPPAKYAPYTRTTPVTVHQLGPEHRNRTWRDANGELWRWNGHWQYATWQPAIPEAVGPFTEATHD